MMMIVLQDQAATTEKTMTMKMTEKSTLQLNMLLDDAVLISEKLAAMKCSTSTKSLRSGSHTDIGARRSNEDQHIHIDDVAKHLGDDNLLTKRYAYTQAIISLLLSFASLLTLSLQSLGVQDVDSEKVHSRHTRLLQDNELLHCECLKTTHHLIYKKRRDDRN
nr:probable protein phosphatase 2C 49 [Tanacetum cinerariifolium]